MFTVYSIGDSAFLEQILIAVSMITGAGDFDKMVAIGLLIGFLIVAFQSLFQGAQKVDFQQILLCWIIYGCMFGSTTTVLIEDAYDATVRPVSNVPVGVGAAAGIISSIGYRLTNMFETGYGIIAPGVTETQFADSLKILNDIRRKINDPLVFMAMNDVAGGGYVDYRKSLFNYIQDCTLVKMDLGESSIDEIMNSNIDSAIRFDSSIYGTLLYNIPSVQGGTHYDCSTGFGVLDNMTSRLSSPLVDNAVATLLGIDTTYGASSIYKASDALTTLGAAGTSGYEYMKAAVIEPVYYEAAAGKYQDMQDYSSALMVNQAIQQRNTQWAAEQTMFMSIVRPMMTFVEGFVFAVTPLMGFLIALGGFGIKLVVKYLQMLLWTQLWMPVLSIVNLFIYMAASAEMASYSLGGFDTFYALNTADDILSNWIATGGMLAAATPILSLVLVTGSTYAMTSLASRMQGGDTINENMTTPDTVSNGPVMQNMAENTNDAVAGSRASGSDAIMPSLALGSTMQSNVQSSQAFAEQKSLAFTRGLANSISDSAAAGYGHAAASSLGRTIQSSGSEGVGALQNAASQYMQDHGISSDYKDNVTAGLQLAAQGGANVPLKDILPASAGANIQGGISSQEVNTSAISSKEAQSYLNNAGFSQEQGAQLQDSLARAMNDSSTSEFRSSVGSERSASLAEQAQEAHSATKQFSEVSAASRSLGSQQSLNMGTLGNMVSQNNAAKGVVESYLQNLSGETRSGVLGEMRRLEDQYSDENGPYKMSQEKAHYTAALVAMSNGNHYAEGQEHQGYNAVLRAAGAANGQDYEAAGNAYSNSGLSNNDVGNGVREEAQGSLVAPRGLNHDQTVGASQAGPEYTPAMKDLDNNAEPVYDHFDTQYEKSADAADQWANQNADAQLPGVLSALGQDPEMSRGVQFFGTGDAFSNLADRALATASTMTGYGSEALGKVAQSLSGMSQGEISSLNDKLLSGSSATELGFPELEGNDSAFRSTLGGMLRATMGDDANTQGMDNAELASYQLARAAQWAGSNGEALKQQGQEDYAAVQSEIAQRTFEHGKEDLNLTNNQAAFLALQSGSAGGDLANIVQGITSLVPGPSPLAMLSSATLGAGATNEQAEANLIESEKQLVAQKLGYERENLPADIEQGVDNVFEHLRAASRAGNQDGSVLGAVTGFNLNMESRDLTGGGTPTVTLSDTIDTGTGEVISPGVGQVPAGGELPSMDVETASLGGEHSQQRPASKPTFGEGDPDAMLASKGSGNNGGNQGGTGGPPPPSFA